MCCVIPPRYRMSSLLYVTVLAAILLLCETVDSQQYNTQQPPYDQYDRNNPQPYDKNNPSQPYDRNNPSYDRNNPAYDRNNPPYDRNNPTYDRNNPSYDRNNPSYDRNNPAYDRYNSSNPFNYDSRYGNHTGGQYDRFNPSSNYDSRYGNNNSQYDRYNNPPPYDGRYSNDPRFGNYSNQPYDRFNQPYNQSNYGNRDQYGLNRDQYGNNRDQYGNNRDQFGNNRDQYGNNRDQYGSNRDQYGNNRDQYGNNRDQYGSNRDQSGNNRDQYGNNRDQFGNNRDPYGSNRDQYGGSNYGSPQSDFANDNCCRDYCLSQDSQPYLNFATKTAYQLVYGKHTNQHKVPDCTPIQFWSINRHGTRLPSAQAIARLRSLTKIHADIIRNYDERRSYPDRGRLCAGDLDLFRRWRWNESISEQNANMLTAQGTMDLKYLARRFVSRFEEIFREPYSDQTYNFQYTDTDRTHDSYQAYIEGLFRGDAFRVHANVYKDDRLIQPTSRCNAYLDQVQFNPQSMHEYERFRHRPEYQEMVRHVFRRLGFRYTLNESIIEDMYDLCRFEKAWNLDQTSPWCMVFDKDQLKLLEYAQDLKYYYQAGYGNDINRRVGCPPLKDLYEKFDRTVSGGGGGGGAGQSYGTNNNKVTVFFTHSATILTLLTAMGIAKDRQPLTADNYYQQGQREWRTSTIDPFAANLAAALYECRSGERHRVMFFLNEVPVNFPECSVGLCNWSVVKNKFQYATQSCNLDFCDGNAATSPLKTSAASLYISLILIVFYQFLG